MRKNKKRRLKAAAAGMMLVLIISGGYVINAEGQSEPMERLMEMSENETIGLEQFLQIPGIMDSLFQTCDTMNGKEERMLKQMNQSEKQLMYSLLKYRFLYDMAKWDRGFQRDTIAEEMECHARVWGRWSKLLDVQDMTADAEAESALLKYLDHWDWESLKDTEKESEKIDETDGAEKSGGQEEKQAEKTGSIKEYETILRLVMRIDPQRWMEKLEACCQTADEKESTETLLQELKEIYLSGKEEEPKAEDESKENGEDAEDESREEIKEEAEEPEKEEAAFDEKSEGNYGDENEISEKNQEEMSEEEKTLAEPLKKIAAIPGYQPDMKSPFQTLHMTKEEKKLMKEKEELSVLKDPEGALSKIEVQWITEEDFLGTDKKEYLFYLRTGEEFRWEEPLKKDYEEKRIVRKIVITDAKDPIQEQQTEKEKKIEKETKEKETKEKEESAKELKKTDKSIGAKLKALFRGKTDEAEKSSVKLNAQGSWDAVNFQQMKTIFQEYSTGYQVVNVHIRGNISMRETLTVPAGKKINIIGLGPSQTISLVRAKGFGGNFFYVEKGGIFGINKSTAESLAGELVLNGGAGSGFNAVSPLVINDGQCNIMSKTVMIRNKNTSKNLSGGAVLNNGTLTSDGVEFSNNMSFHGGAIFNSEKAKLTIRASVLSNNSTYVPSGYIEKNESKQKLFEHPNGGAVFNLGTLKISASRIQNNTSRTKGGGVLNFRSGIPGSGQVEIDGSGGKTVISGNRSKYEGGGIYNAGILKISDSTVSGNQSELEGGGGILTDSENEAEIIRCLITGNQSGGSGGGIFNWIGSKVAVRDCTIEKNQCKGNGGAGILIWENSITSVKGTKISENHATDSGGAILLFKASLQLSDGLYSKNTADRNGGGIYATEGAKLAMTGGSISGNKAGNFGGGIYMVYNSNVSIQGGDISGNASSSGGGIFHAGTVLSVSNGEIENNSAVLDGGGIYASRATQLGSKAVIRQNRAEKNSGGGIYAAVGAEVTMSGTSIVKNRAGMSGGGIHSYQGNIHMKQGSISNNTADTQSGGGVSAGGGEITLEQTSVNSNSAGNNGGGIMDYGAAKVRLKSVKMSGNHAAKGNGVYVDAEFYMSGLTVLTEKDEVYLASKRCVTVDGPLTAPNGKTAVLVPDQYKNGRRMVEVSYGKKLGSMEYVRPDQSEKFGLAKKENYVLRPGDYQETTAQTKKNEIVISQKYQIDYKKNLEDDVSDLPVQGTKYWYENTVISKKLPSNSKAVFLGWSKNKQSFHPEVKPGSSYKENNHLTLYAVWNTAPVIDPGKPLEYWEGEKVTKQMLKNGVTASDREDHVLGKDLNVRIVQIKYADGRIKDGVRQPEETVKWKTDMPDAELLDTWQMEMDKKDSPVIHKITYEVTDSQGLTARAEKEIKVKYNEFPEIICEDRYFTLKEAQEGQITEKSLLKDALEQGILDVSDDNNDNLDPEHPIREKLHLAGFHEDEFIRFKDSGYVKLSYTAEDSLGKQSVKSFFVYVCKDGEKRSEGPVKYVRFINRKNFKKNQGKNTEEMDEEEIALSRSNGGLRADSYWYHNEEYKNILASTLNEPKAKETYLYDGKEVKEIKKYVEENGIGNTEREDALIDFAEDFMK